MYEEYIGKIFYEYHPESGFNLYKVTRIWQNSMGRYIIEACVIIGFGYRCEILFLPEKMDVLIRGGCTKWGDTIYSFSLKSIKECMKN